MTPDAGDPSAPEPSDPGPGHDRSADPIRVRALEELAHATWPCLEEESTGPWLLRAAGGYSRRANSCLADGSFPGGPGQGLDAVGAWYDSRGLEPCLKDTPLLDDPTRQALRGRGWSVVTPSWVMEISLGAGPSAVRDREELHIEWSDAPTASWSDALALWDGETEFVAARHRELHRRMAWAKFLSLRVDGALAGLLVASSVGTSTHLYDLVIHPDLRGRGLGRELLGRALDHLGGAGTKEVVLQVLQDNSVAAELYRGAGFRVAYGYGYWVRR